MKSRTTLAVLLFLIALLGAHAIAQTTSVFASYTVAAAGKTAALDVSGGQNTTGKDKTLFYASGTFVPDKYTVTVIPVGSPAACTIAFEGTEMLASETPTDADYTSVTGDLDCTTTLTFTVTDEVFRTVRMNLKALSADKSVKIRILARN